MAGARNHIKVLKMLRSLTTVNTYINTSIVFTLDVQLHDVMFSATVTWSAWSEWGSCDTQHGCGKGKQKRSRVLVTNQCLSNKSEESRLCKLKSCPGILSHITSKTSQPANKLCCCFTCLVLINCYRVVTEYMLLY